MEENDKKANEIYKKFKDESVINDVIDKNFSVTFLKSYIWLVPLSIAIFLCPFPLIYKKSISEFIKNIFDSLIISNAVIFILVLLNSIEKIYIVNDNIIFKNLLNIKKVFDVSKKPRIYSRKNVITSRDTRTGATSTIYEFYIIIQQFDKKLELEIKNTGIKRMEKILSNFKTKEKSKCSEEEWECSASDREREFKKIQKKLSENKRIIGVKNNKKMNINNISTRWILFFFINVVLQIGLFELYISNISNQLSEWFMYGFATLIFSGIFLLAVIVDNAYIKKIRISYPREGTIKINKYLLDYKNINTKIFLIELNKDIATKYSDFILILKGEESEYSINLDLKNTKKFEEFVDNLVIDK